MLATKTDTHQPRQTHMGLDPVTHRRMPARARKHLSNISRSYSWSPFNSPQKREPQHPIMVAYSDASELLTFLAKVSFHFSVLLSARDSRR